MKSIQYIQIMSNTNILERHIPCLAILGSGNVATHLVNAFAEVADIIQVNSRTLGNMPDFCDVAIISVKDDAIKEVAKKIRGKATVAVHTSGSVPISVLEGVAEKYGVLYPMQTFSKNVALNYMEIPFFIEGNDTECEDILLNLARSISQNVRTADSTTRKMLHLAAVFACNFTNRLVGIADYLLKHNGLDYTVMLPLLKQTVEKLHSVSPDMAQTGPAARKDYAVINAHLRMLDGDPGLKRIYKELTDQIIRVTSDKQQS